MSDTKRSNKSATDYAELAGLRITLSNIKVDKKEHEDNVVIWLSDRIKELADK
tara:strand:+ start:586 stop:744 length:159 start_codon:yes stop_codon:yes gene_type:complete